MADQVDLYEPGLGVVPLVPGFHRDRGFEHRTGAGVADPAGDEAGALWGETTVDRGRGHGLDLLDHRGRDAVEVSVGGHIRQQLRQCRRESLARGAIQGCPARAQQRDRFGAVHAHRITARAWRRPAALLVGQRTADRLAGMVTMPPGDLADRVQDR